MNSLTKCDGCKWHQLTTRGDVCTVRNGAGEWVWNDFDGKIVWKSKTDGVLPSTETVRAKDGRCGPEASLYEQSVWQRIINRFNLIQEQNHVRT